MTEPNLIDERYSPPEPPVAVDLAILEAARRKADELARRSAAEDAAERRPKAELVPHSVSHFWRSFRRWKFVAMFLGVCGLISMYQGCALRSVPLKNQQMSPTYEAGVDMLVIDPTVNSRKTGLQQGDAVVYEYQGLARKGGEPPVFMGRIIAFAGQRVRVEGGEVYVDGAKIDEAGYVSAENHEAFDLAEMIIPRGHVFLLVDNRSAYREFRYASRMRDSRHLGPIKEWSIVGRIKDKFAYGKGS